MEELYSAFAKAGANLIGKVSVDGYTFNESKSVLNGMFCGLAIDEDNESDLSHERLVNWVNSIKAQL
jgi:flavodoxin I|tara:strand:+ start:1031 stop:1231 length:201 start_codon:yes stop_codon:yes gene_type:complete